jgi:hypothetical protein
MRRCSKIKRYNRNVIERRKRKKNRKIQVYQDISPFPMNCEKTEGADMIAGAVKSVSNVNTDNLMLQEVNK